MYMFVIEDLILFCLSGSLARLYFCVLSRFMAGTCESCTLLPLLYVFSVDVDLFVFYVVNIQSRTKAQDGMVCQTQR